MYHRLENKMGLTRQARTPWEHCSIIMLPSCWRSRVGQEGYLHFPAWKRKFIIAASYRHTYQVTTKNYQLGHFCGRSRFCRCRGVITLRSTARFESLLRWHFEWPGKMRRFEIIFALMALLYASIPPHLASFTRAEAKEPLWHYFDGLAQQHYYGADDAYKAPHAFVCYGDAFDIVGLFTLWLLITGCRRIERKRSAYWLAELIRQSLPRARCAHYWYWCKKPARPWHIYATLWLPHKMPLSRLAACSPFYSSNVPHF